MSQSIQQNKGFIENVFNNVYDKYDLMNDIMSFGVHRIWKNKVIKMMNPTNNQSLIDVACGTGDIGKLYSIATENNSNILSVDPNINMINKAKSRLATFSNIKFKVCSAEHLDIKDETFDFYTISFGLRNTSNLEKAISEAFRVLKKGGRFICLEFSKINNEHLNLIYKNYSKIIPEIGRRIVGKKEPYEYLVKSIEQFLNQEELLEIMENKDFVNCEYTNLNGGIVAVHSGWKI